MLTATVAPVKIGYLEIEGLLLSDGSFGVAVPQLNDWISFSASNNVASRDLKRLLGEGFNPSKVKIEGLKQLINCVLLEDVEKLLLELAIDGHKIAQTISRALTGVFLVQLFSDAFNLEFEKEDRQNWLEKRQNWLKDRQAIKDTFWGLTDEIAEWIAKNGSSFPQHHYIASFKAMSVGLFGLEPNQIKAELGIGKADLNRDYFNKEALRRITDIQRLAAPLILNNNVRPEHAVKQAIATFHYAPIEYQKYDR